jgi:hypothetical protein
MKKILFSFAAAFILIAAKSQVTLNEVYTDPGSGNSEFFELYNISTSQTAENLDNYTIVTYYEEGSNVGFYVLDMPNLSVNARSYFSGTASNPFNVQGQSGLTANFSWNSMPAGGLLTKWEKSGSGYTSVSVPANLNDLFVTKSGSGASYHIFIFKNGMLINGLIGGSSTSEIPSYIKSMPNLPVDMIAPATDFLISFSSMGDNMVEYIVPTPGSDNGYIRKKDGSCASWDKSSAQAQHTPGSTNGATATSGSLTINSYITPSSLFYNITAGPAEAFPVTMEAYRDFGITAQLDVNDILFDSRSIASTSVGVQQIALPSPNDAVMLAAKEAAGCYNAVFSVQSLIAPLAVKLLSFSGNLNNNKVVLSWSIASNETTDRFDVERSVDGLNFTTAALVFTSEKSGTESYKFYENIPVTGKIYYRLKMYDKNQTFSYSKIIVLQTGSVGKKQIKIIGNPVADKLTFSFQSDVTGNAEIKAMDMSGKVLIKQKAAVYAGLNVISLPLTESFSKGAYVVEVSTPAENFATKFIKR